MNLQNEKIGDIEQLLIDRASGRIRFAVLGLGGFLEMGETEVAVPWDAFQINKQGDHAKYVLDATKEKLEKAPKVKGKRYDRLYSRAEAEPAFDYWAITWYDLEPLPSPSASPGMSPMSSPTMTPSPTPTVTATPGS